MAAKREAYIHRYPLVFTQDVAPGDPGSQSIDGRPPQGSPVLLSEYAHARRDPNVASSYVGLTVANQGEP